MIQKLIHRLKTFTISMGSVILLLPVITIWPFWFTDYDPAVFVHFFNFIFAPLFILFIGSIHEIEKSPRFISLIVLIAFFGTALNYLGWVFSSEELVRPDFMTVEIIKFELLFQALAGAGAFIIQGLKLLWLNFSKDTNL